MLTRRGRVLAYVCAGLLALIVGMTADYWNPCSGAYVCVVTP